MVGSYWRYEVDQEVVDNYLIWETSVLVVFVHIMTEHHTMRCWMMPLCSYTALL